MSEEEEKQSPLMSALFDAAETDTPQRDTPVSQIRSLQDITDSIESGAEPMPEPAQEQAEQAEQAEEEEKPVVGQREVPLQQPVQEPVQPVQPVQQPVQQLPEPEPDPEDGLLPEQKERLRLARIAEDIYRADPDNSPSEYAGLHAKYLDFYKKEAEYVSKNIESGESLEWDSDYKKLKEDLDPKISDTLVRKLEREEIKRELSVDLAQQKREIATLKNQLHQQKVEPQVRKAIKSYASENFTHSVPEEIRKQLEEDKEGFAARNPFEYEIVNRTLKTAQDFISQFEKVNNGVEAYDPNKHGALSRKIEALCQGHKTKAKKKDGKAFVSRMEYAKMTPEQRTQVYTWGADDVKSAFMAASKATIEKKVNEVREKVSKYSESPSRVSPRGSTEPTPRTATPRTPPPAVSENQGEQPKDALSSMLLD